MITPDDIIQQTDGKGLLRIGEDRLKDSDELIKFKP